MEYSGDAPIMTKTLPLVGVVLGMLLILLGGLDTLAAAVPV